MKKDTQSSQKSRQMRIRYNQVVKKQSEMFSEPIPETTTKQTKDKRSNLDQT